MWVFDFIVVAEAAFSFRLCKPYLSHENKKEKKREKSVYKLSLYL